MLVKSKSNVRSIGELMLNKFQKYYTKYKLLNRTDKLLLAVSGGKDSMVMLNLFMKDKLSFGVLHCNFQLRDEDANNDEKFIRQFCEDHNIDFYSKIFNTKKFAQENGVSIQMAARDLRYNWFEEVRKENSYKYIATAHHKNDVAETMLINLTKGAGLAGLHGISKKRNKVIRPLLCFDSSEIELYVKEQNIQYREDLSNANTKYVRNAIRHNVIPELEKINPAFIETLVTTSNQFSGIEEIVLQKVEDEKKRLFVKEINGFKISIISLNELNPLKTYLYYFLKPYNFNSSDVSDIICGFDGNSGQIYNSTTHQVVKDRNHLLLNERIDVHSEYKEINTVQDIPFQFEVIENTKSLDIVKSSDFAYLDADMIEFPLDIRRWEEGDFFQPLGMKGKKKVSDFLIDNKVSIVDKQYVKVLIQKGEIVWLIGHRISEKYKITPSTKRVLILKK